MDLGAIRTALKEAISVVPGLNVDDLRDNPIAPCAIIIPDTPFPITLTFDDEQGPMFSVLLLVTYNDTGQAQQEMDGYISTEGAASVIAAIERDGTLGNTVAFCQVTELKSYGVLQLHDGGTRYLSAELLVQVWTA